MSFIRIIKTPPGHAPENIRNMWKGVLIPLATEEEIAIDPPSGYGIGNENTNGYLVLREAAILALRELARHTAADYWDSYPLGRFLEFQREACELVP